MAKSLEPSSGAFATNPQPRRDGVSTAWPRATSSPTIRSSAQSMAQLEAEKARLLSRAGNTTNARTGEVTRSLNADDAAALEKVDAELDRRNQILRTGIPCSRRPRPPKGSRTIEEGKAGIATKGRNRGAAAVQPRARSAKDAGDSALLAVNRIVDAQDAAAKTREKAGIREPGSVAHMAEDFASDTTAQLNQFAKDHPFDYDAWFQAFSQGGEGLLPKIENPLNQMADQIRSSISHTLGSAIYDGFAAAFSGKGLGGIFKAFGKTILGGLGQIISDQGMIYLEYSGIMQAFTPLLGNPFTAGFAGAAIGAALIALGAALGAAAREAGTRTARPQSRDRPRSRTSSSPPRASRTRRATTRRKDSPDHHRSRRSRRFPPDPAGPR
jgi:hypothetical protein